MYFHTNSQAFLEKHKAENWAPLEVIVLSTKNVLAGKVGVRAYNNDAFVLLNDAPAVYGSFMLIGSQIYNTQHLVLMVLKQLDEEMLKSMLAVENRLAKADAQYWYIRSNLLV